MESGDNGENLSERRATSEGMIRLSEVSKYYLNAINGQVVSALERVSFQVEAGEFVSVYQDGRKIAMISLGENVTKSFRARGGRITLRVKNGKAWVSESPCRHKICLHSPPVSIAGERIICAPNHFLLEIKGSPYIDTSIG